MLLDRYEQQSLLYNINFKDAAGTDGWQAYRGDLTLVEGEIADASGRRKPPVAGIAGAVILTNGEKIKMIAGFLDAISDLPVFIERYSGDFADDMKALFYVPNVHAPIQAEAAGKTFVLIPLTDGMVWNEMMDELSLEKSDFKGQSAAEKVVTMYEGFASYKPKYATLSLDEALSKATSAKREDRGPV